MKTTYLIKRSLVLLCHCNSDTTKQESVKDRNKIGYEIKKKGITRIYKKENKGPPKEIMLCINWKYFTYYVIVIFSIFNSNKY